MEHVSETKHEDPPMTTAQSAEISEGTKKGFKAKTAKDVWHEFMDKPTKTQRIFAWCMIVLVLVESSFLFIQAGKCFVTKSAKDIDLLAFCILLASNVLWTLYGAFVLHDLPLILSGVTYCIGAILVIVAYMLYNDPQPEVTVTASP